MSDITPLATYHSNFRLAFWPDRQLARDLLAAEPGAGDAGTASTDSEYQPAVPLASAGDDARLRLPPQPSLLGFPFFGGACLPR